MRNSIAVVLIAAVAATATVNAQNNPADLLGPVGGPTGSGLPGPASASLLASAILTSPISDTGSIAVDQTLISNFPCLCTLEYQPWCGEDGMVYANECFSTLCGTQEALFPCNINFLGTQEEINAGLDQCEVQCENQANLDDCLCTLEYMPWCAEDGLVYPNQCAATKCGTQEALYPCDINFLGSQAQFQADLAACEAQCSGQVDIPCLCTLEYMPWCAEDGKVYSNQCFATKCGTQEPLFPCDIDFSNPDLNIDDAVSLCEEQCLAEVSGDCLCTLEYMPWCGEDGQVYSNQCAATKCQTQEALFPCSINFLGTQAEIDADLAECEAECSGGVVSPEPCLCTLEYMPWCGEDGVVYSNKCLAEKCSTQEALFACPSEVLFSQEAFQQCEADCAAAAFDSVCSSDCSSSDNGSTTCTFDPDTSVDPSGGPTTLQMFPLQVTPVNTLVKAVKLPQFSIASVFQQAQCLCLSTIEDTKWCSTDGTVYGNKCLAECGEKRALFECTTDISELECENQCMEAAPSPSPISSPPPAGPPVFCPSACTEFPDGELVCVFNFSVDEGTTVCVPPTLCNVKITKKECSDFELGDVNLDDMLSIQDVVALITALTTGEQEGVCFRELADLNLDGELGIQDIVLLIELLLS